MTKILVVDDEPNITETLKYNLTREGYEVSLSGDGRQALEIAHHEDPDLVILDLMLPGMSGLDVCKSLRKTSTVPILMLTAREDEIDRIISLELGADNYMTKPFSLRELVARVRSMLRRMEMQPPPSPNKPNQFGSTSEKPVKDQRQTSTLITTGDFQLDLKQHIVTVGNKLIALKPMEFELLAYLLRYPGQVFSREELLERVWAYEYTGGTRTVDVHIRWLREKIETDPSQPRYLKTIFGVGYKMNPDPAIA